MSHRLGRLILVVGMLLTTLVGASASAQETALVAVCPANQSALLSAIADAGSGGTVVFTCDTTITLSSEIELQNVTLDGNNYEVTISGNKAVRLFSVTGTATFIGLNLINGYAGSSYYGGAIWVQNGKAATVINCTFSYNEATVGGAIGASSATVMIVNSTFRENDADDPDIDGSGGAIGGSGTLTVLNSTLENNRATGRGGAIEGFQYTTIVNSTFSENIASKGGAINFYRTISPRVITNSTFVNNVANAGRTFYAQDNMSAKLSNSIVADAVGSAGLCDYYLGMTPFVDGGGNLVTDFYCGLETIVRYDALKLGELADNGGRTQTIALGTGSVAIGAGVLATCTADPVNTLDQRGYTRPTTTCDSGAYDTGAVLSDGTAPDITPIVAGTLSDAGWYTSDISISWRVSDDNSLITSRTGCDTTTITHDTTGFTVTCKATSAGGTSTYPLLIRKDATAPVVTVTGVTDGATYTPSSIPAAGCTTTDATSGVATDATLSHSGGPLGEVTATCAGALDNAGNPGSKSVTYTVADPTAPVITPVLTPGTPTGQHGWYVTNVYVNWSIIDHESTITNRTDGCDSTAITDDTTGTTLTCSAASAGGTSSESVTIKRDITAPVVSVTGVTDGGTYVVGAVPDAGCTTSDATSGVQTAAALVTTGGPVGDITVTCAGAVDQAGNISSPVSATYSVHYDWQGFTAATDARRGPRKLLAGPPLTVVFSIKGDVGLDAVESITSIACNAAPGTEPTDALPVGRRGELQQGAGNSFIFQWKTSRAMAGTCQVLRVTLTDGTSHDMTYIFL